MNREGIRAATAQAKRFLKLAEQVEYSNFNQTGQLSKDHWHITSSPKLTGELRRASLDLTRRLAEMRKSN